MILDAREGEKSLEKLTWLLCSRHNNLNELDGNEICYSYVCLPSKHPTGKYKNARLLTPSVAEVSALGPPRAALGFVFYSGYLWDFACLCMFCHASPPISRLSMIKLAGQRC